MEQSVKLDKHNKQKCPPMMHTSEINISRIKSDIRFFISKYSSTFTKKSEYGKNYSSKDRRYHSKNQRYRLHFLNRHS